MLASRYIVRLADFIRTNADRLILDWEDFAAQLKNESALPRRLLRDHVTAILKSLVEELEDAARSNISSTIAGQPGSGASEPIERVAAVHVNLRIDSGFDLAQIVAEYQALRAWIIQRWRENDPEGFRAGAAEIAVLLGAIDRGIAKTIPIYEEREIKYRDLFLGMLGHDLRNPLNAIALSADSLMMAADLSEKEHEYVMRMIRSTRRISRMINDISDLARGRLGVPMQLSRTRISLMKLAHEIADEVQHAIPSSVVTLDAPTSDISGNWDAERLRQLISNLLTNAVENGAGKPVRLIVAGTESDATLEFHNDGPPIPAELLSTMFDPLVRGKGPRENRRGLGLGLYIASQIISAHGGAIDVLSSEDNGTTFTVRLPRGER